MSVPIDFGNSHFAVQIRDLLRQGAMDVAEMRISDALANRPDDAEALYLKGIVANRRRDHSTAIDALRRSVSLRPDAALAWLGLGNAYARADETVAAVEAYRQVVMREPSWADAHFNLGLALRKQGDLVTAAGALYAAWTLDPMQLESAKQCVATLAQRVRQGERAALPALDPGAGASRSVTIVVCSVDAEKHVRTVALYRRLFEGLPHEIVVIRNARSLAEAYNAAVARSSADIIILSHDDIDVLAPDFAARLYALLHDFDGLGVVGSNRLDGPTVGWSGHPHLRGWITHHAPSESTWSVDVLAPHPIAGHIAILDGVLLAARRAVLAAVPFDAETFDGFHLYDIDWSYRAARAGFRLGVAGDLLVVHASRGRYDDGWRRYADCFCAKHAVGTAPPAESPFFGAMLDDAEQVRSFFALLSQLRNPA